MATTRAVSTDNCNCNSNSNSATAQQRNSNSSNNNNNNKSIRHHWITTPHLAGTINNACSSRSSTRDATIRDAGTLALFATTISTESQYSSSLSSCSYSSQPAMTFNVLDLINFRHPKHRISSSSNSTTTTKL
jgi:hypothetical protein